MEEYLAFGGRPISLNDVRVHELLLVLGWLEETWREHQKRIPGAQDPDTCEHKLRSLYRRVAS
ncbi:MAG: hypothetical protein ACYC6Y_31840 [Thermoguttaceae bacterium]